MALSPKRMRVLQQCFPFYYPFGNTPAHNVFEGLEMVAEPAGDGGDNKILNVRKI